MSGPTCGDSVVETALFSEQLGPAFWLANCSCKKARTFITVPRGCWEASSAGAGSRGRGAGL